ncbi:hypothetical protein ACJX0J_034410, partial [Zea mays]
RRSMETEIPWIEVACQICNMDHVACCVSLKQLFEYVLYYFTHVFLEGFRFEEAKQQLRPQSAVLEVHHLPTGACHLFLFLFWS